LLTLFDILCIKARKCGIVISPSGCGKSRVSEDVANAYPQSYIKPTITTRSGLGEFERELSNSNTTILIDDLSGMGTPWSRKLTTAALTELTFSHNVSVYMRNEKWAIINFHGSTIINAQPDVYDVVISSSEFEGGIRDKTLRYYHLIRPEKPNSQPLTLPKLNGKDIDKVETPNIKSKWFKILYKAGRYCWSPARTKDHVSDLLKASAALDDRTQVNKMDYKIVYSLLKRMRLEKDLIWKETFEAHKHFNFWILYLLTECVGKPRTINEVALNYGISINNLMVLLHHGQDYVTIMNTPKILVPTEKGKAILKEAGYV
jgi:hypothetical protein